MVTKGRQGGMDWEIGIDIYTLLLLLLSHFSCVQLCVTPQTAAHQAPRPWDSPGKNTGVGCHFLLQCMKVKSESEVAQSCPTLSDPTTAAFQAPPSMGFSRQEYWSGVPLPSPGLCTYWTLKEGYGHPSTMDHITTAPANKATKETYLSCVHGLSHGQSSVPGKNTGVGCHFLLQGIFLTQGSNLCQLHWQVDSLLLSHLGSPQLKGNISENTGEVFLKRDPACVPANPLALSMLR